MSDITLDTLTLPYDLVWIDEFQSTGVFASARYSLGGVQHIETSAIAAGTGRPITLYNENAWIVRSDLETLYEWACVPGKIMTLTLADDRQFKVMFRHWEPPVIEADNIGGIANAGATHEYILQVRLVTVPAAS